MDKTNHDKNCRKQQTNLGENSTEYKGYPSGHSREKIKPKEKTKYELLEQILEANNMNQAYQSVVSNKGAAGVDGITTDELLDHLKENKEKILGQIRVKKYKPKPVKRVEIPKDNGKTRPLGIPTTTDRVIQQSIHQILSPIYEKQFSNSSFGFRPGRSSHDALKQVKQIANQSYERVVDLDLETFFDTVNQSKLIEILSRAIKDGDVISLIHKYLKSGIMINGVKVKSDQGVPQGGPLSPLLANIILNEADQEFEKWGYKFVRYADDLLIFAKNRKAAERYYQRAKKYLEKNLRLKVNEEKTSILKAVTGRSNGMGHEYRRIRVNQIIRGWIQYFKLAKMKSHMQRLDQWLRRRIRICAWKAWKKVKTKYKYLSMLGIDKSKAWDWANSRKAYWRVSGSWILTRALNNKRITDQGYLSLADYYEKVRIKL